MAGIRDLNPQDSGRLSLALLEDRLYKEERFNCLMHLYTHSTCNSLCSSLIPTQHCHCHNFEFMIIIILYLQIVCRTKSASICIVKCMHLCVDLLFVHFSFVFQ